MHNIQINSGDQYELSALYITYTYFTNVNMSYSTVVKEMFC